MVTISREQALARWDTLPDALREALASDKNSTVVRQAAEAEHLSPDKARVVGRITGWVLMGFIHPEDAVREIQDALSINVQIATKLSDVLNRKIFNPLRNELENVYEPATAAPRVEEVKKPAGLEATLRKIQELAPEEPKFFKETRTAAPAPAPPVTTAQAKPAPSPTGKEEIPPAAPPGAPAPLILHQESEASPISPATGFKLTIPTPQFREPRKEERVSARPARLEIGGEPKPPPLPSRPEPEKPKVVHYSTWRTPLKETGGPQVLPAAGPPGKLPGELVRPSTAPLGDQKKPPLPATPSLLGSFALGKETGVQQTGVPFVTHSEKLSPRAPLRPAAPIPAAPAAELLKEKELPPPPPHSNLGALRTVKVQPSGPYPSEVKKPSPEAGRGAVSSTLPKTDIPKPGAPPQPPRPKEKTDTGTPRATDTEIKKSSFWSTLFPWRRHTAPPAPEPALNTPPRPTPVPVPPPPPRTSSFGERLPKPPAAQPDEGAKKGEEVIDLASLTKIKK